MGIEYLTLYPLEGDREAMGNSPTNLYKDIGHIS